MTMRWACDRPLPEFGCPLAVPAPKKPPVSPKDDTAGYSTSSTWNQLCPASLWQSRGIPHVAWATDAFTVALAPLQAALVTPAALGTHSKII